MKSLSLSQPHIIAMVGLPGSGKTFFAEKFAETFGAPFVSHAKIAHYATDTEAANQLFAYQIAELLKTHQSIIVEGDTATRTARGELAQKARKAGYEILFLWVQTDAVTAKSRFIKENKATSDSPTELYEQLVKRFTPPATVEKPVVLSGKHTYASQAKVVLKKLSEPRAEISVHTTTPARPESRRRNITIR